MSLFLSQASIWQAHSDVCWAVFSMIPLFLIKNFMLPMPEPVEWWFFLGKGKKRWDYILSVTLFWSPFIYCFLNQWVRVT
jgi:hypothetical protein